MNFNIELPLSNLSFGQISVGLLVEIYRRGLVPSIYPIGQVDISSYDFPEGFIDWLNNGIKNSLNNVGKKLPYVKIWHLNGAEKQIPSSKTVLFTAHECSESTDVERQICGLYDNVLFTSEYSRDIFLNSGVENAGFCPNFFDSTHFKKIAVKKQEGIIQFSLIGKLEKRKNTHQILASWAARYGGNPNYRLNCLINNPFLPPEVQQRSIDGIFKGATPGNINPIPHQQKNSAVNELINFCDISIDGLSGSEGWNLGPFHSAALGKQAIVLDAHGHKSWANQENFILLAPNGTQDIYDSAFFRKGDPFNQGNMFTFNPNDAIKAFEFAEERVKAGVENSGGLKLQEQFPISRTLDTILNSLFN